jgi:hypothetical protein
MKTWMWVSLIVWLVVAALMFFLGKYGREGGVTIKDFGLCLLWPVMVLVGLASVVWNWVQGWW